MLNKYHSRPARRSTGFSLVEVVISIILVSIISIGLVQFIVDSASGYSSTARRNKLSSAGRVVVDRISMELHNALPNSVRISSAYTSGSARVLAGDAYAGDQCIEFVPVRAATTYIDPAFRPRPRKPGFDVVDFVPDQVGETNVFIAVYPRNAADIYNANFAGPNTSEAIAGASVADALPGDGINEITTSTNHRFKRRSPNMRSFLTDQPVSYCILGQRLYRYTNYGFSGTQLRPADIDGSCSGTCLPSATPDRVLITTDLNNGPLTDAGSQAFDQLAATRRRNAVIQLDLSFAKEGDEVLLNHEVLLHSTP